MTMTMATPVDQMVSRSRPSRWTWVPTLMSAARRWTSADHASSSSSTRAVPMLGVTHERVAQHRHDHVGEQRELEEGQADQRPEAQLAGRRR